MPILENPRHEAFARELAKGKSATGAYEIDGQECTLTPLAERFIEYAREIANSDPGRASTHSR